MILAHSFQILFIHFEYLEWLYEYALGIFNDSLKFECEISTYKLKLLCFVNRDQVFLLFTYALYSTGITFQQICFFC